MSDDLRERVAREIWGDDLTWMHLDHASHENMCVRADRAIAVVREEYEGEIARLTEELHAARQRLRPFALKGAGLIHYDDDVPLRLDAAMPGANTGLTVGDFRHALRPRALKPEGE